MRTFHSPWPTTFGPVLSITAAGVASGAQVVVVTATHAHPMATPYASVVDYARLAAGVDQEGRLRLTVSAG